MEQKNGKRIQKPRTHTTSDMYKFYKKKVAHPVPEWMYKEVLSRHNKRVADAVIFGQVFNFGHHIGNLLIKKISRNYEKMVVNWGASLKLKKEIEASGQIPRSEQNPDGPSWLIYFTDSWYLRWGWIKKHICRVKNQTVYKFVPTANKSKKAGENTLDKLGNKGKLVLANRLNPNLHMVYNNFMRGMEKDVEA